MDRSKNLREGDYTISNNHSISGAPWKTYAGPNDDRSIFDVLDFENHRPYLVQITCMVESPMKLFVQNQNYSKILVGSDD